MWDDEAEVILGFGGAVSCLAIEVADHDSDALPRNTTGAVFGPSGNADRECVRSHGVPRDRNSYGCPTSYPVVEHDLEHSGERNIPPHRDQTGLAPHGHRLRGTARAR